MKNVSYANVTLNSGYLYEKYMLNKNVTIDAVYKRFFESGRIEALKCGWKEGMEKKPHVFWDSDVAKWMEGAAYLLQKEDDAELERKIESIIDDMEANQTEDGYFNSYFITCDPEARFTRRHDHELYCAGHFMEAAVAYYEATGRDRFLGVMRKYADCIKKAFIDEKTAGFVTPGYEEIEMALVRMYRATGDKQYLDMAAFFINNRGVRAEEEEIYRANVQSHVPVREQKEAVGHAVRACYLYSAMADLAYETDDKELYKTCKQIFDGIVNKKMSITGGVGARRFGEAFSYDYDLVSEKAYNETCAAIALLFFANRMMQFENNAVYADVAERILYNGMMSGLSLDGDEFFYENPLEINLRHHKSEDDIFFGERYSITERVKVFDCSCCPPNLNRVLASIGDYVYGYEDGMVYVNQFVGSEAEINGIKITQRTNFPVSGEVKITVEGAEKLCVRIPSWCKDWNVSARYHTKNGYAVIENPRGEITFSFGMKPFIVESNTNVYENIGKVAVCVGPYVCAAESADNIENLHSIYIDKNADADFWYSDDMSGYVLKVKAYRRLSGEELYSAYNEKFEDFTLTMIPYAAFANRGSDNMLVWFNVR